jgi:peptide methionine sulfoxide reductase MsrB
MQLTRPQRAVAQESAGDSHHGQVLADGPVEERGRRSGINAAALRLLPDQDLQAKGDGAYGKFLSQAATTKGTKR